MHVRLRRCWLLSAPEKDALRAALAVAPLSRRVSSFFLVPPRSPRSSARCPSCKKEGTSLLHLCVSTCGIRKQERNPLLLAGGAASRGTRRAGWYQEK